MTIPTMMNCEHSPDGWCLQCVAKLKEELDMVRAQRNSSNRRIEELQDDLARLPDMSRAALVIEAAKYVNFCPDAGGFNEGRSVEDCFEELDTAVQDYFGTKIQWPMQDWISEEDLEELIKRKS